MYNEVMGMREKPRKIYIQERKQGKKSPFGFPPIPPSIKLEADCFPVRKKPETSRTYPRWDRNPNLQRIGLISLCGFMFTNYTFLTYTNKPDLALNNLKFLICHKTNAKN